MGRFGSKSLAALLVVTAWTTLSHGFRDPGDVGLPADFDVRASMQNDHAGETLSELRAATERALRERFGQDVVLRWGDLSATPQLILSRSRALAPAFTAKARAEDPVRAARELLRRERAVLGLGEDDVRDLVPFKSFRTKGASLTHVVFEQRVGGLPVFEGRIGVHLDRDGGVLNIGGEWFSGLKAPGAPVIGAGEALSIAAEGIALSGNVPPVLKSDDGAERRTEFETGGEYRTSPVASLLVVPLGSGDSTLAWDVRMWEAVSPWGNLYQVLIDAGTGEPLVRRRLTMYVVDPAQATGVVFERDPLYAARVEVSLAGDALASPANWVTAEQTLTTGNNVRARSDRPGDNDPLNPMADGGQNLDFDFRFDDKYASRGRIGDEDAAIANGFYFGNLYHDYFYSLGFDEAAGNFQQDNFGRGGLAGDPVDVDVQDSWDRNLPFFRNNANWSPTVDGVAPRTQYYLFTDPERDSAFDGDVYFHEFSHGLSTRLVGGAGSVCLSGAQPGGMGEGWGDFFAVSYFATPADDPAGPVAVGEYSTGDDVNGIRRFPYSHDLAVNPLTYVDLCDGGSCAVHDEGEIWAVTLWDIRHDLIAIHGFEEGRRRTEQITVDAMKLSPCNPHFVTMRDLVLQASEQRYGTSDSCVLRAAFARRGLGAEAYSIGTSSNAGASFDVVAPLDELVSVAADGESLVWNPSAGATSYPVARGSFSVVERSFDNASCVGETLEPEYLDPETPAPGAGFYYLFSISEPCGTGSFGSASDGAPRGVSGC